MKISEKIKEITERAQKLVFPNKDSGRYFITLSVGMIENNLFQVCLDKWDNSSAIEVGRPNYHGPVFDPDYTVEHESLAAALEELSILLDNYDENVHPEYIFIDGCSYVRDGY